MGSNETAACSGCGLAVRELVGCGLVGCGLVGGGNTMSEVRAGDKLIGKGLCANCGKWIYQKSLGKYNLVVWHHATGEQVCVGKGLCCKYAELKQKRGTQ